MMNRLCVVAIALAACGSGSDEQGGLTITKAASGVCDPSPVPVNVQTLALDGDTLTVQVYTQYTCVKSTFAFCWDGAVEDTAPGSVDLVMSAHPQGSNPQMCEGGLTSTVQVDLGTLPDKERPLRVNILDQHGFNDATMGVLYP